MDDIAYVVEILQAAMPNIPISTEIPPTRPERAVVVSLVGDASDPLIHRPRIMCTVWGVSDLDAHEGAISTWHALAEAAQTDDLLSSVTLESMSRDEWVANGAARYIVQLDLVINT